MKPIRRPSTANWLLVAGPAIWLAHLLVVYASQSLFCSRGVGHAYPAFIAAVSLAAAAALALLIVRPARAASSDDTTRFVERAALLLGVLSLCAVLWTSLAAVLLPGCELPLLFS